MKKLTKLFLIVFIGLLLVGCSDTEESKYLQEISYDELLEKVKNNETFFFEIMSDTCSHCQSYTPKLIAVLEEYDIKGYQLNVDHLTEEEYNELKKTFETSGGTPETIFITEGKEKTKMQRIDGDRSKTTIIARLKSAGYIKDENEKSE